MLDLRSVFSEPGKTLPVTEQTDLSDFSVAGIYPIQVPVLTEGVITNKAGLVEFSGTFSVTLTAPCDRCFEETTRSFSVPFHHVLVEELSTQEMDDSDEFILLPDSMLDLGELVRQDIVLWFPSKYLCRDDCKGLCPMCGANLNHQSCGCRKEADPRLAALQSFFE